METKNLGLAAYLFMHGVKLISTETDGRFVFERDVRDVREWEIEYVNSCCFRHDSALMTLRRMLK